VRVGLLQHERVAYQERICRAGASADLVRVGLLVGFWGWLLVVPLGGIGLAARSLGPSSTLMVAIDLCLALAGSWFGLSFAAFPLAAAYRRFRAGQLLRELVTLERDEAAAVLLPLQDYCFPDTRAITQGLIRDLRLQGNELCPARPGTGSGTEAASPGSAGTLARIPERYLGGQGCPRSQEGPDLGRTREQEASTRRGVRHPCAEARNPGSARTE
jgi:hypothetical protein